jgi:hypothetical protein
MQLFAPLRDQPVALVCRDRIFLDRLFDRALLVCDGGMPKGSRQTNALLVSLAAEFAK